MIYCKEAKAFTRSYDLAPRPLPPVSWRHTGRLRKGVHLLTGEEGGRGGDGLRAE
jgi:hypothetical protein